MLRSIKIWQIGCYAGLTICRAASDFLSQITLCFTIYAYTKCEQYQRGYICICCKGYLDEWTKYAFTYEYLFASDEISASPDATLIEYQIWQHITSIFEVDSSQRTNDHHRNSLTIPPWNCQQREFVRCSDIANSIIVTSIQSECISINMFERERTGYPYLMSGANRATGRDLLIPLYPPNHILRIVPNTPIRPISFWVSFGYLYHLSPTLKVQRRNNHKLLLCLWIT